MTDFFIVVVILTYAAFSTLDAVSMFPRISGSLCGKNAIGSTVQVIVNTFKRIFLVSSAPMLGFIAISGGLADLVFAGVISSITSGILVIVVLRFHPTLVAFFCRYILRFAGSGSLVRSLLPLDENEKKWTIESREQVRSVGLRELFLTKSFRKVMLLSTWIFSFYSASIFILNILASRAAEYASVIVQLTGFANALGTLALAFFLDPILSRSFEKKAQLDGIMNGLLFGRIISHMVVSPSVFLALGWML